MNESTVLNVPGISCDHCKHSIEGAVGQLSGVERVEVDIPARTVEIDFDRQEVSLQTIVAAIDEAGYEVK